MDSTFRTLHNLSQHGETPDHQIVQNLNKWKTIFSKKWFDKHYDSQPVQSLKSIWKLLFVFVESEDAAISVAAFHNIGALLISLSPFYSDYLIESFGEIVVDLNVTSNASIAVISTFVFLSHFVGPHKNTHFFESICVLHFFSADLYNYIQFIPQLIQQMSQMNFEFHQRLMRSLLTSFGRNPNSQFVDSIICLMERFPRRLMNELLQFLDTNNLTQTLFAIGSKILEKQSLSSFISEKQMRTLFDESKKVFEDNKNASSYEQAVQILSNLANITSPIQTEVINYIDDICSRDFPQHIKRNLIALSRKIEYVIPRENDSSNFLMAKVSALSNFGPEHDHEVIPILLNLVHRKDVVFASVAEYLSLHLGRYMKNAHKNAELSSQISEIINKIIVYTDRSWVQQTAIAKFIGSNNQFECIRFVPDYIDKCIKFLISICVSDQQSLAEEARKAAVQFVGHHNIHRFLSLIITTINFFNEDAPYRVIMLLNELYKTIPKHFYNNFIPIFDELIRDNQSKSLTSEFLFFLSNMKIQNIPHKYENICMHLMQHYYFSFTGVPLLPSNSSDVKQISSFLQNVSTDIVANSSLNYSDLLEPLHKCFKFLIAAQQPSVNLVMHLLPLFPFDALKYLYNCKITSNQVDSLIPIIISIFHQSQDMNVTALCVKFLIRYSKDSLKPILNYLINMIHSKQVQIASVGHVFLKAIRMFNDNWNNYAFCLLSDLTALEKNLFVLKLAKIADKQFLEALIIQFPFIAIDSNPKSCVKWLNTNSLKYWPINNQVFCMKLAKCIDSTKPKFVLDTYEMDNEHWIFLLNYRAYFDISILKNRQNHIKTHFNMEMNSSFTYHHMLDSQAYPKIVTLAPLLKNKGEYVKSVPLLTSFLNFSNVKIQEELVDQIISDKFENEDDNQKVLNASIEYKKRLGYYTSDFEQQVDVPNIFPQTLKSKDIRKFCVYTDSYTPIQHLSKIASLFSAEIEKLTKPKMVFYFIRFLRIVLSMKLNNYQMILSMTLYNLDKLIYALDNPDQDFPYFLLKEIAMLLFNNLEWKNQNELALKYPIFESFLNHSLQQIQFLIEFKPPSYQLHAIRACHHNDLLDPMPYFLPSITAPLLDPLLDVEYGLYIATHFHYLTNLIESSSPNSPKDEDMKTKTDCIQNLIKTVLTPTYPAIDDCYNLLIVLLTFHRNNPHTILPFFDISYKQYYMMKTLIDLTVIFYENNIPDTKTTTPVRNKLRSHLRNSMNFSKSASTLPQLESGSILTKSDSNSQNKLTYNIVTSEISNSLITFLKCSTLRNAKSLSSCLLKHSSHYLITTPMTTLVSHKVPNFGMSYLATYLTLKSCPEKFKQLFTNKINNPKMKFRAKSHHHALKLLLEGKYEEGYLYATVETNNLNAVPLCYGLISNQQAAENEIDQNKEMIQSIDRSDENLASLDQSDENLTSIDRSDENLANIGHANLEENQGSGDHSEENLNGLEHSDDFPVNGIVIRENEEIAATTDSSLTKSTENGIESNDTEENIENNEGILTFNDEFN